jgi:hypothetical protein
MTRRRTKNGRRKIFEKIYVRLIKFEILLWFVSEMSQNLKFYVDKEG